MDTKDKLIDALHTKFGVCGHCGKKDCGGKRAHSVLPNYLNTDEVMDIIDNIFKEPN